MFDCQTILAYVMNHKINIKTTGLQLVYSYLCNSIKPEDPRAQGLINILFPVFSSRRKEKVHSLLVDVNITVIPMIHERKILKGALGYKPLV